MKGRVKQKQTYLKELKEKLASAKTAQKSQHDLVFHQMEPSDNDWSIQYALLNTLNHKIETYKSRLKHYGSKPCVMPTTVNINQFQISTP